MVYGFGAQGENHRRARAMPLLKERGLVPKHVDGYAAMIASLRDKQNSH